jgi:hypothetical protein
MKNSYLNILYISVFWNQNIKQAEIAKLREMLKKNFRELVRNGYRKFENKLDAESNDH